MNSRSYAIKQLIAATPACAGKTAAEITTILNNPTAGVLVQSDIPRRKTMRFLASRGIISKVYDRARDTSLIGGDAATTHQIRSICFAVEAVVNAGAEGIDTGDPGNAQMWGALKAAGIVTQADIDALTAAASTQSSHAIASGLGVVTVEEVSNALTSFS